MNSHSQVTVFQAGSLRFAPPFPFLPFHSALHGVCCLCFTSQDFVDADSRGRALSVKNDEWSAAPLALRGVNEWRETRQRVSGRLCELSFYAFLLLGSRHSPLWFLVLFYSSFQPNPSFSPSCLISLLLGHPFSLSYSLFSLITCSLLHPLSPFQLFPSSSLPEGSKRYSFS